LTLYQPKAVDLRVSPSGASRRRRDQYRRGVAAIRHRSFDALVRRYTTLAQHVLNEDLRGI
jgi:hypothetical protein